MLRQDVDWFTSSGYMHTFDVESWCALAACLGFSFLGVCIYRTCVHSVPLEDTVRDPHKPVNLHAVTESWKQTCKPSPQKCCTKTPARLDALVGLMLHQPLQNARNDRVLIDMHGCYGGRT